MEKKKFFGMFLIFAGIFMFFLHPFFTMNGFAVKESIVQFSIGWLRIFGAAIVILGVLVLAIRSKIEKILGADAPGLKRAIKSLVPGKISGSATRKRIYEEVGRVLDGDYNHMRPHDITRPPTLHLPRGKDILSLDASEINDALNLRGKGKYRHFKDDSGRYLGLARHIGGLNDYEWVYRMH